MFTREAQNEISARQQHRPSRAHDNSLPLLPLCSLIRSVSEAINDIGAGMARRTKKMLSCTWSKTQERDERAPRHGRQCHKLLKSIIRDTRNCCLSHSTGELVGKKADFEAIFCSLLLLLLLRLFFANSRLRLWKSRIVYRMQFISRNLLS